MTNIRGKSVTRMFMKNIFLSACCNWQRNCSWVQSAQQSFPEQKMNKERCSFCLQLCADQHTLFYVLFHLCNSSLQNIPSSLLCCKPVPLQNAENSAFSLKPAAWKASLHFSFLPCRPHLMQTTCQVRSSAGTTLLHLLRCRNVLRKWQM